MSGCKKKLLAGVLVAVFALGTVCSSVFADDSKININTATKKELR